MVLSRILPDMVATTVLIVDDHPLVRTGLVSVLSTQGGIRIVGAAANGKQAVRLARRLRPQVVLMDLVMPVMDGCEATRQILGVLPTTRVIVLSAYGTWGRIREALVAGACGFVLKQSASKELYSAIKQVLRGKQYFCSALGHDLEHLFTANMRAMELASR